MDEQELREERKRNWRRVVSSHKILKRARKLLSSLEKHHLEIQGEYQRVDRELAMIDGRFQKAIEGVSGKISVGKGGLPKLTREQLREVINELKEKGLL